MNKPKLFKITDLVLDFNIYPRGSVDSTHKSHIVQALLANEPVAPLEVTDEPRPRIVDGFHRHGAFRTVKAGKVPCIQRHYKDEAEMIRASMEFNKAHGLPLSKYDRLVALEKGLSFGLTVDSIAAALGMKGVALEKMSQGRTAVLFGKGETLAERPKPEQAPAATTVSGKGKRARSAHVILKPSVLHLAGKQITPAQAKAVETLGGNNATFYVNQIITILENGLVDKANKMFAERIKYLRKLLSKF